MKNIIKELLNKIAERKAKKQRIKAKLESVLADYDKLIQEFKKIEENPSRFSKKYTFKIKSRVHYLISKGHIVVNSKP